MSYRNKTYVAFASEDIKFYRLMEAWRDNKHIDFNFFDAHDLYVARDSSKPESIKARLGERLKKRSRSFCWGRLLVRGRVGMVSPSLPTRWERLFDLVCRSLSPILMVIVRLIGTSSRSPSLMSTTTLFRSPSSLQSFNMHLITMRQILRRSGNRGHISTSPRFMSDWDSNDISRFPGCQASALLAVVHESRLRLSWCGRIPLRAL
ncbi:TIR domain-containing protein [Micromonospora sp. NPDC050417]|uniref:TIR domain-containing protein n=1 Tax=Micromonospora sp. NPDC050417 TaxID=3364280 RepID=UPI00378CB4B4